MIVPTKEILIICPTRGRVQNAKEVYRAWKETTSGRSHLLFCVDPDDEALGGYKEQAGELFDFGLRVGTIRKRLCPWVNHAFDLYPNYKYYCFIGDDHRFRTKGWEDAAIDKIGDWGIWYADDKFQGVRLATQAVISGNIPRTIGYLAIPGLIHLFMDNFWMELGFDCGFLHYDENHVIEHMHPAAGKAEGDDHYVESNSHFTHDQKVFNLWSEEQRAKDVAAIKEAMKKKDA